MFNSESFLTMLKTSDNADELQAVKEKLDLEIAKLRSRDTGDDDGMNSFSAVIIQSKDITVHNQSACAVHVCPVAIERAI